jgi:hypothetical protein
MILRMILKIVSKNSMRNPKIKIFKVEFSKIILNLNFFKKNLSIIKNSIKIE